MLEKILSDPLHLFPLFRTSDPEELFHVSASLLGASRIDLKSLANFEARVNLVQLRDIGLAFGATSSAFVADHGESDFIRVQIALRSRATTTVQARESEINERQIGITPAGVPSRCACEAGHERLTLRLNQPALSKKLEALLGRQLGHPVFASAFDVSSPGAACLLQLTHLLAQQIDSTKTLPPALCRELEQAVQVAFLSAGGHSFSSLLDRDEKSPAATLARNVEEYIEANWQNAIDIESLAAQVGVSARTLFRAFRKARGFSPMVFAKSVRLDHARRLLMSGDPAVSVTAVAFQCNFANPGHFAKDFRDAFGELPSETLLRSRRTIRPSAERTSQRTFGKVTFD